MAPHDLSRDELRQLLRSAKTIAVVGCSPDPTRTSHRIAARLQSLGYRVIPVHPKGGTILGETVYTDLASIPAAVALDIVDVFRRAEHTPAVARAAVARHARALWLQLGIVNQEACDIATQGGLACVMDRCLGVAAKELR